LRPRESWERSRRPIGASGGAAGLGGGGILTDWGGLGAAAGIAAGGVSASVKPGGLAARCLLRSGFVCFATLSHSARSSSLRLRLRRGGAGNSGIEVADGRFIGCGDNAW
jgi:hypothetical protein